MSAIETMPSRSEWLKARRNSIGASEAAAVLGLHPYHSPMSLYVDKTTDAEPSEEETEYQEWGHSLEPALADKYQRVTGRKVSMPGFISIHSAHRFITATPDRAFFATSEQLAGLIEAEGLIVGCLELKTADRFKADDDLPIHWQVQVQQQMYVTGAKVASFAILGPFRKFYTVDVSRNEDFIELLVGKLQEFWKRHVLAGVPPSPDGHSATTEALKRLYPRENGTKVELPVEFGELSAHLESLKASIKTLETEEKEIENQLRASIGEATFGVLPDGTGFSLKTIERAGYVAKASSYRQLRRIKKGIL